MQFLANRSLFLIGFPGIAILRPYYLEHDLREAFAMMPSCRSGLTHRLKIMILSAFRALIYTAQVNN